MKNSTKVIAALSISTALLLSGCSGSPKLENENNTNNQNPNTIQSTIPAKNENTKNENTNNSNTANDNTQNKYIEH